MTAAFETRNAAHHAAEQCEILLAHLRQAPELNPRFLQVHTLALLGIISDLDEDVLGDDRGHPAYRSQAAR